MKKVFGILCILGAAVCAFFVYMESGGKEGFGEFQIRVGREIFEGGDATLAAGGVVAFLMLGLTLLFSKR